MPIAVIAFNFFGREFDQAVDNGKNRIVFAQLRVFARMVFCPSLADNDGAAFRVFAVLELDPEPFAF